MQVRTMQVSHFTYIRNQATYWAPGDHFSMAITFPMVIFSSDALLWGRINVYWKILEFFPFSNSLSVLLGFASAHGPSPDNSKKNLLASFSVCLFVLIQVCFYTEGELKFFLRPSCKKLNEAPRPYIPYLKHLTLCSMHWTNSPVFWEGLLTF